MIARKVVCRMTKREARAWAKARRAELDMTAVGRGMAQALFSLPQWQSAGAVLAFAAMPDEPDTAEILRRALAARRPARRRPGGIRRGAGPCPLPCRQPRRSPAGARRRVL